MSSRLLSMVVVAVVAEDATLNQELCISMVGEAVGAAFRIGDRGRSGRNS